MVSVFAITRVPALWEVLVPVLFGVWFFAFAGSAAGSAVKWHSRLWGFSGSHRQYEIAFRLAGVGAVLFGVWMLVTYLRSH